MKRYFLGQAACYSGGDVWGHLFAVGRQRDLDDLVQYLGKRYQGEAMLCKNGRSALCLALKAYFDEGDAVIVNGFTCYAVYEAVVAAGLVPVFVDISRESLNFDVTTLEDVFQTGPVLASSPTSSKDSAGVPQAASPVRVTPRGIIIQNSLGNTVDIEAVEKFAKKHNLTIIEDLAHCTGVKYADGRECGTVGAGVALSFGKDKSIDTISGGAVVLRAPVRHEIEAPSKKPQLSCHLRAKFYPLFGAISRGLTSVHLGGALMQGLVKIHWVEKSADNRLDLKRRISKFEAKLALPQFEQLKRSGELPIREFALVDDRDTVLRELAEAGYYFDGLWYKQPVSPERYYKKVHFPEEKCPEAVFVAEHIINFPTYYARSDLKRALEIVKNHLVKDKKSANKARKKTSNKVKKGKKKEGNGKK